MRKKLPLCHLQESASPRWPVDELLVLHSLSYSQQLSAEHLQRGRCSAADKLLKRGCRLKRAFTKLQGKARATAAACSDLKSCFCFPDLAFLKSQESTLQLRRNGDVALIRRLLHASTANTEQRDKHSRTAVHLAAWAGQVRLSVLFIPQTMCIVNKHRQASSLCSKHSSEPNPAAPCRRRHCRFSWHSVQTQRLGQWMT